eukprot:7381387-Pyramimonas_sp.AAC.1
MHWLAGGGGFPGGGRSRFGCPRGRPRPWRRRLRVFSTRLGLRHDRARRAVRAAAPWGITWG